jgi:hypothetical protein
VIDHDLARTLNKHKHLGCDTWRPCVYGGGVALSPTDAAKAAKAYADNPPSPADAVPVRRRTTPA